MMAFLDLESYAHLQAGALPLPIRL
jgi:hypothetical protein